MDFLDRLKKHYPLVFLFLASFIFIYPYLQKGFIFAAGEMSTYLNPSYYNYYSLWEDKLNFGFFSAHQQNIFLFSIFWNLLSLISGPYHVSIIFNFALYFLSGFFFYLCLDFILKFEKKYLYLPACLLYTFNVYRLLGPMNERINLLFVFLPLYYLIYNKILHEKKWIYVFLFIIIAILATPLGGNPPIFFIPYFLIFFYFVYYLIFNRKRGDISWIIKSHLSLFFLLLLVNMFWIYSIAIFSIQVYDTSKGGAWIWSAINSGNFADQLRFLGSWAWRSGSGGQLYYSFSVFYDQFFLLITTYAIPILSLCLLIFVKKSRFRFLTFFMLIASLISLILMSGTVGPFGFIYRLLYLYFPGFRMYREPFAKFMPLYIFIFCFLFTLLLYHWFSQTRHLKAFKVIIVIICGLIFINAYPLFNREAIPFKRWGGGYMVKIPDHWGKAKVYLENDKVDRRVLESPFNFYSSVHIWEYGIGLVGNAVDYLIDKNIIRGSSIDSSSTGIILNTVFNPKYNSPNFLPYYSLLNTKYLLQENEIDWRWDSENKILPPSKANQLIKSRGFVEKIQYGQFTADFLSNIIKAGDKRLSYKDFFQYFINQPALKIYALDNKYFLPHFYVPDNIVRTNLNVEKLADLASQPDYKIGTAFYFNKQNLGNNINLDFLSDTVQKPIIEFKKISQTKYRLIFHQAKDNFPLVFVENYHKDWQLYLQKYPSHSQNLTYKESDYYAFKGNEEDQADSNDIKYYLDNSWLTTLGDGKLKISPRYTYKDGVKTLDFKEEYKIDFISKNVFGTIQNNNLSNNSVWETWQQKPLFDTNHMVINGFANGWIIKPQVLCQNNNNCRKNADGSYDLEIIVEFSSQKFFMLAFILCLTIFGLSCLFVIILMKTKKTDSKTIN